MGVSLGPGDPQLVTRAAWEALQRRDTCWVYPVRSGRHESHAFGIVQRSGISPVDDHQPLVFPMTYDAQKLARAWLKAAQTVLPKLQAGQDVLFLVEGDASTYATFSHLARTVQGLDDRIQTQVLAGVNAFTAAGARLGLPLAEQDDTLAVAPAAYGVQMLERLLTDFDTLVLMKVKPVLDDLLDWLSSRQLLADAHFIERVGAVDERCLSGQDILGLRGQKVSYLSLLIVRHQHRVRGERVRGCLKKPSATAAPEPAPMPVPAPPVAAPSAAPGRAASLEAPERVCLLAITKGGIAKATRLAQMLPNAVLCTLDKFADAIAHLPNPKYICRKTLREELGDLFGSFDQFVCFVSLGAVVRLVAPHLKGKEVDPGVVVVDDAARYVIPMLSGHVGGANAWAERVASLLDAQPVLTTASDAGATIAVDILGRALGWTVQAPKVNLTRVAAAVVNGERIAVVQDAGSRHWWTRRTPLPANIEVLADMAAVRPGHHRALLWITHQPVEEALWRAWPERLIIYRPPEGQQPDDLPADTPVAQRCAPVGDGA